MSADVCRSLGVAVCATAGLLCLLGAMSDWRQRRRALARTEAVLGRAGSSEAGKDPRAGGAPVVGIGTKRARPAIGAHAGRPETTGGRWRRTAREWLPAMGALCTGYVLLGGALGALLGVLGGCAVWRWQRGPTPDEEFDAARAVRDLPLAADLLSACIAAGAGPVTAACVVGESLGGPVGERLAWGAAEVRLGGTSSAAWRRLAELPGAEALAALLERAGDSGAPAAAPVARLATEARSRWGREATARARRAGVLITAPVGLCFLPAFIAVGVLPVVIGLASGLLAGNE